MALTVLVLLGLYRVGVDDTWVQLHHWFSVATWQLTRAKTYLESCRGPSPIAEEMRCIYLAVLQTCEDLLHDVSLSPAMWEQLAREEAQLNAAIHAQRTRKQGVRRKAAPAQMVAD